MLQEQFLDLFDHEVVVLSSVGLVGSADVYELDSYLPQLMQLSPRFSCLLLQRFDYGL